jgi:molybdate transport system substrate-binding protein
MEEVVTAFENDTGVMVSTSYGGSQSLAQQIVSGAPAALFVSAGASPVSFVDERTTLDREPVHILNNRLVLAVAVGERARVDGIPGLTSSDVERIAIADPNLSPAGKYARESLEYHGLWDRLQPKMVFAADVRAAMAYVESGNADAALVYATDADASRSVTVASTVPEESHSPIVYPVAVISGSGHEDSARKLVEYLRGAKAREVFGKHGFASPE